MTRLLLLFLQCDEIPEIGPHAGANRASLDDDKDAAPELADGCHERLFLVERHGLLGDACLHVDHSLVQLSLGTNGEVFEPGGR